jgi:hypothetical protein
MLVGNSSRLLINRRNGEKIDGYDIVVRMNHGIPTPETIPFVGNKVDIWVCSFNSKPKQVEEYKKLSPKQTIRLNNDMVDPSIRGDFYIWPEKDYNEFKSSLGFLPTTGCLSAYFFREKIKPLSLSLIGFDFFQSNVFYSTKDFKKIAYAYHSPDQEKAWMENYIKIKNINHIKV